jgi:ribonuclease Z
MNRFVILGSANAVPKLGQDNTHLFVESGEKKILVDCGDNALGKLSAINVDVRDVTDLILTHFHADHVGSLPLLVMGMWLEKRTTPLTIHGLGITLEKARKLLELFDWEKWKGMFPVSFKVIPDEGASGFIAGEGVRVTALPVLHLIPTIGLRFEFREDRVISYSCDSEPCDALDELARGVDVLLQETAGESKGHSSARQAGLIAAKAGVKRLVMIHYNNRIPESQLVSEAREAFSGEIVCAKDLMVV